MNQTSPEFRKLFEKSTGLFIVLLPNLKIAAISDDYCKIAGLLREDVMDQPFFDIFPPDSRFFSAAEASDLRQSFAEVLRAKKEVVMTPRENTLYEGSGVKCWGSLNAPILNERGEVAYIIRRVEDITSRRAVEKERDVFFSQALDLLGIVGTDGYFKRINPSFERALGYSIEELMSRSLFDFLHPDDVHRTQQNIQSLAQGIPMVASVNRYQCKDGSYKWFSWNTTPMGNLLFTVGRDISDQMNAEDVIRQLNVELEEKNEILELKIDERIAELRKSEDQVLQLQKMDAIGRLAGGIAHDFNNMLGAISLYCDLLTDNLDKPESIRRNVQNLADVAGRAAALTRQLLVFSRKQIVQFQTIDLNPLIKNLESMLVRLIGENIKIVNRPAKKLNPISVDPSQMEQVVMNLVMNARDAMPKGGVITIETSNIYLDEAFSSTHLAVVPGDYVMLTVSDDGEGMDAETVSKIFEPFFTTKPVGKGTGLGLTTTYGIIKQSKGSIWVYSEPGYGTVFKIYFPVSEKFVDEPVQSHIKLPEVAGTETILLAEDDDKLREGFSAILRQRGYEVLVAVDAREALSICEQHPGPIHLLLTDMLMPGINGYELAQKSTAIRTGLRVLYMSGYTNDALANTGIEEVGRLEFIQKPFGSTALLAKVREVLSVE